KRGQGSFRPQSRPDKLIPQVGAKRTLSPFSAQRSLIVNADDFGLSAGINQGIVAARERGIVTSASLMVRWPAAVEAAAYGRAHPDFSLGLHVDLGEWSYRDGGWVARYQVVAVDDPRAVSDELARQVDSFRNLT